MKIQTSLKAGELVVYGLSSCRWCKKQINYLESNRIPYMFIDCATGLCPGFVKAFPTIDNNGVISEGYQAF